MEIETFLIGLAILAVGYGIFRFVRRQSGGSGGVGGSGGDRPPKRQK